MNKGSWRVFYPLLLGLYAAVGLVAVNIDQMFLVNGLRSVVLATLFSLLVFLVFNLLIREPHKAALLCAWFLLFFLAYGHVYDALEGMRVFTLEVGRHRYLFPLWALVFTIGAILLLRRTGNLAPFSRVMNAASLVLLLIPVVQICIFELNRYQRDEGGNTAVLNSGTVEKSAVLPDVYYIIMDGYPRADVLLREHDFDNREFIRQLEDLGFYVAACSQSNYSMTNLSLATSLNMDYLEGLNPNVHAVDLNDSIQDSTVRRFLESLGYQSVSFASGIWFTELHDADHYIDLKRPIVGAFFDLSHPSEFEILFIRTTVLRLVEESGTAWLGSLFENPRQEAYDRIQFAFDQLEQVPSLPGPKFVFVHILAPHSPPFIFDAQGGFTVSYNIDPELGNELQYLNRRLLSVVEAILAGSATPPVIIFQGDHGLDTEVRNAILNAYFFPGDAAKQLYPQVTPVNSFRLVLNAYFGQHLPLLPDRSFYSSYEEMFNFQEVLYPCEP